MRSRRQSPGGTGDASTPWRVASHPSPLETSRSYLSEGSPIAAHRRPGGRQTGHGSFRPSPLGERLRPPMGVPPRRETRQAPIHRSEPTARGRDPGALAAARSRGWQRRAAGEALRFPCCRTPPSARGSASHERLEVGDLTSRDRPLGRGLLTPPPWSGPVVARGGLLDHPSSTRSGRLAIRSSPCPSSSMTATGLRSRPILDSGHPTSASLTHHRADRSMGDTLGHVVRHFDVELGGIGAQDALTLPCVPLYSLISSSGVHPGHRPSMSSMMPTFAKLDIGGGAKTGFPPRRHQGLPKTARWS